MKPHPHALRVASLGATATLLFHSTAWAAKPDTVDLLVKSGRHTPEAAVHALLTSKGGSEHTRIPGIGTRIVRVPAQQAERILAELRADPSLEYAEPDATAHAVATTNDPYFTSGAQWYLNKIGAPAAWDISTGSNNVRVAVVDSGVLASHPDLAGKVLPGYDFVNNDSDPSDDNGHGTAVAGLIAAATNNQLGMAGLGWSTSVVPVKALDAAGSGSYSGIANSIIWAADQGVKVINLSLGGTTSSRTLQDAVNYAWNRQIVVIAAAGNNGNSTAFYPAACANVVAVSATNSTDTRPSWSNYGSYVDLSAPGAGILTLQGAGSYANWDGTSFSSPIVAGATALMIAANPGLSNSSTVSLLLGNCDDIGNSGYDIYYGNGRLNAARAVQAAWNSIPVDATPPSVAISSPTNGQTVAGTVNVAMNGTDNVGVTRVELWIDGVLHAQSSTSGATFAWDTTGVQDGGHVLEARAYDAMNLSASTTIQVNVANSQIADLIAPVTAITSPANGSRVSSKSQKITVTATDNIRVTKVELYIDGKLAGSSTTSPVTFTWNTSRIAPGAHTLRSYAYDAAGNIGTSTLVTVYR